MPPSADVGGGEEVLDMAEKPILFSGEMVRAILDGRKTQTRRVIKLRDGSLPEDEDIPARYGVDMRLDFVMDFSKTYPRWQELPCPYGYPGDLLWVRETWQAQSTTGEYWHEVLKRERELHNWAVIDRATNEDFNPPKWIPSIFMPRWASRITLEVTAVRVERLQDISPQDCQSEGLPYDSLLPATAWREAFSELWDSINAKRGYGWNVNPFVFVVEFKLNK